METIVVWFTNTFGGFLSREAAVFIISLLPILECRGGLLASKLLSLPLLRAIPICVIGNILPIPFILLLIKKILKWMHGKPLLGRLAEAIERRAERKSGNVAAAEFMGLMLFVGIPLPGTGAWTGSLIAALLDVDFKKAIAAELLGVAIATVIMSIVSYGLLGLIIG